MTGTDAKIAAIKAQLAALETELADLAAASASTGEPQPRRLLTAADGREAARRRHPGRTRSEVEADKGTGTAEGQALPLTGAAAGIAEARRRHGRA